MVKFFPRDTRLLETTSGLSSIFTGLCIFLVGIDLPTAMTEVHHNTFWALVLTFFGLLQFFSSTTLCAHYLLRAIMTWVVGFWFVWISINLLTPNIELSAFTLFFMGVANFYAFLINFLTVAKKWMK